MHTPLITGSDCEGAGEMFRVTTLDPDALPLTEDGKVDYSKDFFGKPVSLTVSGQLNAEIFAQRLFLQLIHNVVDLLLGHHRAPHQIDQRDFLLIDDDA